MLLKLTNVRGSGIQNAILARNSRAAIASHLAPQLLYPLRRRCFSNRRLPSDPPIVKTCYFASGVTHRVVISRTR